jgi:integrase
MSVRERRWYSRSDAQERAKELAKKAGREEFWREYLENAKEQLKTDPRRSAWICHYRAGDTWHIKTFDKKKDAAAYHDKVRVDVKEGVHTAPSKSITVKQAAADWIRFVEGEKRERSTIVGYQQHIDRHILPRIGTLKIATLTTPRIQKFRDDLLADLSRPMAKKVLTSLKSLLRDAKRRGNVAQNVALDVSIKMGKRDQRKLKVGVDIPTRDEIKALVDKARGRWRPFFLLAIFTGLRSSELRGLRWEDVNFPKSVLHVHQRADRWGKIDKPKSSAGERTVPIPPLVLNALREWKLNCPKVRGEQLELVFPNGKGRVENHANIINRGFMPLQKAAGVVTKSGKPKYPGLHSLRHFYASWCINRRAEGGLELPLKMVQARMGHASIQMTADVYGHLFPSSDDSAELEAAARSLLG